MSSSHTWIPPNTSAVQLASDLKYCPQWLRTLELSKLLIMKKFLWCICWSWMQTIVVASLPNIEKCRHNFDNTVLLLYNILTWSDWKPMGAGHPGQTSAVYCNSVNDVSNSAVFQRCYFKNICEIFVNSEVAESLFEYLVSGLFWLIDLLWCSILGKQRHSLWCFGKHHLKRNSSHSFFEDIPLCGHSVSIVRT